MDQGEVSRLQDRLKTLRCPADLWLMDEYGCQLEIIGGIEPASGQDDKRVKWAWWFDGGVK